ncbi:hypothetical protein M0812_14035 [Anaeramoeba flamelloides]|uniref:Uncharacterized protein n=1 Tax=Anaeramoeba flamelloides TaxID=1746091 RepID=A0AAV7ZJ13_9EUKA|nr:hypothetical protein M0812_14035 [Anaeramoeba flamelloides]
MSSIFEQKTKRDSKQKSTKKFGIFLRKKRKKSKKQTKTKTGKIKRAFRKKLKGRTRKEKSAVTALFVLSTKKKQKKDQQENKKKNLQLLQKLENGLNSSKRTQQQQEQQQEQGQGHIQEQGQQQQNNEGEVNVNHLRSLYTQYNKPVANKKTQKHQPQNQELDCDFLTHRMNRQVKNITEDTTSTYDQFGDETYDDSLSEDLPSASNEEFFSFAKKTNEFEIDLGYDNVSEEEMESLGDEIEIQFGSMQNEENVHHLIFPEKFSFVSNSYAKPTCYPKEYLFGKF